ncbi:hypothetical protein MRB53_041115 [Persea americana]|nr:hypothetical protein MRB53_041115 [Persea americana]
MRVTLPWTAYALVSRTQSPHFPITVQMPNDMVESRQIDQRASGIGKVQSARMIYSVQESTMRSFGKDRQTCATRKVVGLRQPHGKHYPFQLNGAPPLTTSECSLVIVSKRRKTRLLYLEPRCCQESQGLFVHRSRKPTLLNRYLRPLVLADKDYYMIS